LSDTKQGRQGRSDEALGWISNPFPFFQIQRFDGFNAVIQVLTLSARSRFVLWLLLLLSLLLLSLLLLSLSLLEVA
jgi:hypothetical protein